MTEYCLNLTERQVRERIKRLALILTLLRKGTVPIKRNLTGNAGQNAFCCRSTCVPVPVMYLFGIRSVPVLYPFHICSLSVLFSLCQCSIGKRSWNSFRITRFPKNSFTRMLPVSNTQLTLSPCVCMREFKQKNLHFLGENASPVTRKIWEEDCIITSRPVTESFFPK